MTKLCIYRSGTRDRQEVRGSAQLPGRREPVPSTAFQRDRALDQLHRSSQPNCVQTRSSPPVTAELPECCAPWAPGDFNSQEAPRPVPQFPGGAASSLRPRPRWARDYKWTLRRRRRQASCSAAAHGLPVAEVVVACAGYGGRQGAAAEAVTQGPEAGRRVPGTASRRAATGPRRGASRGHGRPRRRGRLSASEDWLAGLRPGRRRARGGRRGGARRGYGPRLGCRG